MNPTSILLEHMIEQREAMQEDMDELMGEMGIEFNEASRRGFKRRQLREIKREDSYRRERVLRELQFRHSLAAFHFPNRFEE